MKIDEQGDRAGVSEASNGGRKENEGYWDGKQLSTSTLRAATTLGVIGTLGASLASCNRITNNNPEAENDRFPKAEGYAHQDSSEISPFVRYGEVEWSTVEGWSTFEPLKVEEVNESIEIVDNTQVILLPVKNDYFYNKNNRPALMEILPGTNFEIENIYSFQGNDKEIVRFAVLPNVMGSKSIPILLLDNGHLENDVYVEDHKNYRKDKEGETLANFSYLVGENEVYPNKIVNILIAMEHIAQAQEREMFIKGREYSYLNLIDLKNLKNFKDGFTSSRAVVRGGGVCAGATLLSNTLYELGQQSGVSWKDIVQEKWAHPSMYYVSPFATNDFITDATVELSNDDQGKDYDFRWVQPEDGYLKIDVSLIPNSLSFADTEPTGIGGPSDVEFLITLSFTKENPGEQSKKIREYIDAYENYRSGGQESNSTLLQGSQKIRELDWQDSTLQVIMDYIYPDENSNNFAAELDSEGGYLPEISELKSLVNSLPNDFSGNLGDYIKTKSWYLAKKDKDGLNEALDMLNYTKVSGQPLQCVGFAVLLSAITNENLHIQNVGGARSFGDGFSSAQTATELIPRKLFIDEYLKAAGTGYGGVALASKDMSIDDYKVGDLFIRADVGGYNSVLTKDGSQITFQTGHIGAIVGRKIVDGETVLLVADSNRKNDGRIMIFEVTEHNFYKIFGDPGVRKFIIRSAENAGN